MARGPTIYDIAARARVGIATVSRVINGSARVADGTRDAVMQAMGDLGFRPNRAARRLAAGGPNRPRVAALLPFFSTNFYFSVCKPLSQGLSEADIDLVLFNVANRDDKQRLLDRVVRERSCEALLLCSMGIGADRQAEFARLGVPVVVIDYPLPGLPTVTVDNVRGGELAARHLVAAGSQKLGLISGPDVAHAFRDRERGFRIVAGADAPMHRAAAVTVEDGRAAAKALLGEHPGLDGLVCVNDLLAVGALDELRRLGARVPEDVQVIGYDDQPLMDVIGLSTVHQPMDRFGSWAADALCGLLNRREAAPPSAVLPLSLVPRSTTRKGRATTSRSGAKRR
jgi:DNA-binding LacI/PurR family transcriptional regulator